MERIDRKKRRIVRRPARDHMGVRSIDEKAPFSTRCSPAHFLKVVSKHVLTNEAKVDALKDVGFGDLLKLCTPILQIQLCKWICVHFDFAYSRLEVGVGKNLIKFEESDVHQILGIPQGDTAVNVEGPWVDIQDMAADFGLQNVKGKTTSWNHILGFIKEDRSDGVFVRAFIIYSMAVLLAPTSRREIRLQFLHSLRDCSKIKSLNWCQYVHRSTVNGIKKWRQARGREGNRRTYAAGCMYVLMIWYMEKTYIEGFSVPTKFPLSSAWTEELVCERLSLELNYFKNFGLVEPRPSNVRNPTYSADHSRFRTDHNDAYPREIPHEDVPSSSSDPYTKIFSNIQSLKQCIHSHDVAVCNYIQQIEEQLTLLKSQQKPQSTEHHPNMGFDTAESPSAFTSNPPQQPTESPFVDSPRASPTHHSYDGEQSIPPHHNQSTSDNRSGGHGCSASGDEDGDPVHDVEQVHVAAEEVVSQDVRRSIVAVGKRRVTRSAAIKSPFVCSVQAKTMIPNPSLKKYVHRLNDASIQSDEIVCAMANFHLTKAELLSLMPKHWVNNMVIQMFCAVFNQRVDSMGNKTRKIYITPAQMGGIINQRLSPNSRKQLRTVCNPILRDFPLTDLSVVEMVFFPINQGNHWFVIVVNIRDGRFDILDCRSGNRNFPGQSQLLKNLTIAMGYVLQEAKHERADVVSHFGRHHGEVPKCATTDDCGVWSIAYMDLWDGRMTSQLDVRHGIHYRMYYIGSLLSAEANTVRDKIFAACVTP